MYCLSPDHVYKNSTIVNELKHFPLISRELRLGPIHGLGVKEGHEWIEQGGDLGVSWGPRATGGAGLTDGCDGARLIPQRMPCVGSVAEEREIHCVANYSIVPI